MSTHIEHSLLPSKKQDKNEGEAYVLLASPYTYDLGMLSIGFLQAYHTVRDIDGVCVDRIYYEKDSIRTDNSMPAGIKHKLTTRKADLIITSMSAPGEVYDFLSYLEYLGIDINREKRKLSNGPCLMLAGPVSSNPEALADIFDLFFMGNDLRGLEKVVNLFKERKNKTYYEVMKELAYISGVYVSEMFIPKYKNGRLAGIDKVCESIPNPSFAWDNKEFVLSRHLPSIVFGNTAPIAPNMGCRHHCAFCALRNNPINQIPFDTLSPYLEKMRDLGIENIVVHSPSITGYKDSMTLLNYLNANYNYHIGSLRIDELNDELMDAYCNGGPSHYWCKSRGFGDGITLTIAPESGDPSVRKILGKNISETKIKERIEKGYSRGMRYLYFYFIIGVPGETLESHKMTVNFVKETLIKYPDLKVIILLSCLIPTAYTKLERVPMLNPLEFMMLVDKFKEMMMEVVGQNTYDERIKWNIPDINRLAVEHLMLRADRRVGSLLLDIFDKSISPVELFNSTNTYEEIASTTEINLKSATSFEEGTLPWEHIVNSVVKDGEYE
jgi:radical SAM superfamily enzyme YgiQ (UPF0313 family)